MPDTEPISQFETLYEIRLGADLPLPTQIDRVYGHLNFPDHSGKPYVISNFVTSLDGVVTLGIPGHSSGGEISGFNPHDRFLMGLLRAIADVVIISSGNLLVAPNQVWTPEAIYPPLAQAFQALRFAIGKPGPPVTAVVTSSGRINLDLPAFQSGKTPVVILTTDQGASLMSTHRMLGNVQLIVARAEGLITAHEILTVIQKIAPPGTYVMEAGPHMHAEFIASGRLDEIFLTLAPQLVGRLGSDIRPGLVADRIFAPGYAIWEKLYSIKRSESHIFLRYGLLRSSPNNA